MTDRKLTDPEAYELWREAGRRLRRTEVEPPFEIAQVDALLRVLGPRPAGQDLRTWLRGGAATDTTAVQADSNIIPFDPRRQRFRPIAEITRLAADTGVALELPERDLESQDGQFRMRIRSEGGQIVLELSALGFTTDTFTSKLVGLASLEDEEVPVALIQLDEDGDGSVRLPDSPALRQALLRPVIGLVEDF